MTEDLVAAIAARMSAIDRPGDFCASGARVCPMPGIEVDGVGPLAMPVLPFQADQLIAIAEAAPYGRGADTLVDAGVRKTWQIEAAKVHITDAVWQGTLEAIVADVAAQLGAGDVRADLYKVLVYDHGSFFASHRDTEKVDGMFATLVVCLPSRHDGGDLVIRHQGREETIDLRNADVTRVTYAAFYADCVHEIRPITAGNRVCLVYNLVRAGAVLVAPDHRAAVATVADVLRAWSASDDGPTKLLYVLEHHYTPAGLSFAGLKNGDAAAAQVLVPAAGQAGCVAHLAMVSIHEEGSAEPIYSGRRRGRDHDGPEAYEVVDVMEHAKVVADWLLPDDTAPDLVPIPWDEEEVCPRGALDALVPDEEYFTEATGNEGGSFERTYRRAALVVWPENRRLALVAQAGVGFALPLLSTLPVDEARELAHRVSDIWPSALSRADHGGALRGTYLHALATLGETKLASRFFDTVVLEDGYDGAENEGVAACWTDLDADAVRPRVVALVQEHAAEHPAACADLVERLASLDAATAVRPAAEALLAHLPRSRADRPWARSVPPDTVARILNAIARIGDVSLVERAVDHVLAEPKRYPMDEVVVPAAIAIEALPGAVGLVDRATTHLSARIALPLAAPTDFARPLKLEHACPACVDFESFLADPTRDRWAMKLAEQNRKHLRAQAGLADVDFVTIRKGSPLTLTATKNQRSFDRRMVERADDLAKLARLRGAPAPRNVRLWLDDLRPAPEGWIHVRTAPEAITRLKRGDVAEVSLDHDLGEDAAGTGYDVACAIEQAAAEGRLARIGWRVHSANPVGRDRIKAALEGCERWWNAARS